MIIARNVMNRFVLLCCISLLASGCDSSTAKAGFADGKGLARLALIGAEDFVPDRTGVKTGGLPDELVARISERLTQSQRFAMLERTALRRVVLEQRFGQERGESDIDRLLDKAVDDLEDISAGTLYVAGSIAGGNDVLKDFQDLGTAADADYIVYAKLEKLERSVSSTAVPYSQSGKTVTANEADARLYLRVIEVSSGRIVGSASLRTKQSETSYQGAKPTQDQFSIYDEVGRLAAGKIIDMVFPARIVSVDPLVINRGANDGAQANDIYAVIHEGKEIKDANGVVLGKIKSETGKVKISQVQGALSVVSLVEGNAQSNDLVELSIPGASLAPTQRTAKVSMKQGAARQAGQLPRVALGLVKTGSTARTGQNASEHMSLFTDTIISRLAQTKRFQMIDRQEVDQLLDEQLAQAMAENRPMPSAMGTLEGADYLVYGSVASFSVEDKVTQLPGSKRVFKGKVGHVEGNMRIVDARSGDILESRKISVAEKLESGVKGKRMAALLADAYAEQVVLTLMEAVYPIKVAAVTADGTVYINRGNDGGLYDGEVLQAFRPGAAVIDPDTGVQLGVTEELLGDVTVTSVEDARAKGRASSALQVGDLLKRSRQNKNMRASTAQRMQPAARSGSNLSSTSPVKGKATLAVGKVLLNRSGNNELLAGNAIDRVTNDLIVKLSHTRRFELMERQQVDQIIDEKAFTAGAQGGDIEASLAQLEGADYLVHGSIDDFYINTKTETIAALGTKQTRKTGVVEASLRIVDVHTGKVIAADRVRINHKMDSNTDRRQVVNNLIDRLTSQMVNEVVGRLYPIKVLGITADGTVFINRGGDSGISRGDQYLVMRPGEALIDPDTGVEFGSAEMRVGQLEVTEVEDGRSRAVVVSGDDVRKGDILREDRAAQAASTKRVVRKVSKPGF